MEDYDRKDKDFDLMDDDEKIDYLGKKWSEKLLYNSRIIILVTSIILGIVSYLFLKSSDQPDVDIIVLSIGAGISLSILLIAIVALILHFLVWIYRFFMLILGLALLALIIVIVIYILGSIFGSPTDYDIDHVHSY